MKSPNCPFPTACTKQGLQLWHLPLPFLDVQKSPGICRALVPGALQIQYLLALKSYKTSWYFHTSYVHPLVNFKSSLDHLQYLTQCKEIESVSSVVLCLILCKSMDCSLPASSVYGISRLEYWSGLPFPFSGDIPQPRDRTQISCIAGRFFTILATREAPLNICALQLV